MNKKTQLVLASLATTFLLAGCASGPSMVELYALTDKIVKASFRDQSHVKVERITATDETNRLCSEADVAGKPLDEKTAKRIEEANLKAIKWPSDGKFIGDWKEGEKIAQSGRGLTWTDKADAVNGGNCYNCHKIDQKEISYGTIGPAFTTTARFVACPTPTIPPARPSSSTPGARSGTPRPTTLAPTCLAQGIQVS